MAFEGRKMGFAGGGDGGRQQPAAAAGGGVGEICGGGEVGMRREGRHFGGQRGRR